MRPRLFRGLAAGLSLLWLASTLEGSGAAYNALLLGSLAAGFVTGAYGSLAPGTAAIVAITILSVTLGGEVALAPLLTSTVLVALSSLRVPRGLEAISLAPPLAAAALLAYMGLRAPEALAAAAPRLPGDTGVFLAAFVSSKTGVMLSSVAAFLAASYLAVGLARAAAEVAVASVSPREAASSERLRMLEELERYTMPGYLYWLMGALTTALIAPYLASLGVLAVAAGAAIAIYFRLLLEALMDLRLARIALLTWPLATALLLFSGGPAGLAMDAVGLRGGGYVDPLEGLADPLIEAYVEDYLRRAVNVAMVAIRLLWGG